MRILLDSSVIIDFLRRKDKEVSLLYSLADSDLYISIITHTELYAGKSVWENETLKEALEKILDGITIIPLENEISQKAGHIKAKHNNNSLLDCIIAATVSLHDMQLATLNMKDFQQIEEIKLFSQE